MDVTKPPIITTASGRSISVPWKRSTRIGRSPRIAVAAVMTLGRTRPNLGLAWMVFATLFPLGILQLYHSISVSYYDARTLNYIGSHANAVLEWLRMPGDIVFILGGALPILYICFQGIRHMQSGATAEEPKDMLFTDIVVQER